MKLLVTRISKQENYTIGKLYINGVYECDTLEDKTRLLIDYNRDGDFDDSGEGKIFGRTAMPEGVYKVVIDYSSHFKKDLPHILEVPGFIGIRIHPGNTENDTEGCILLGFNKVKGKVIDSQKTFAVVFDKLKKAIEAHESVTIEIV